MRGKCAPFQRITDFSGNCTVLRAKTESKAVPACRVHFARKQVFPVCLINWLILLTAEAEEAAKTSPSRSGRKVQRLVDEFHFWDNMIPISTNGRVESARFDSFENVIPPHSEKRKRLGANSHTEGRNTVEHSERSGELCGWAVVRRWKRSGDFN